MTLAIVFLTTPSATLSLNQPINSDAIVFLYKTSWILLVHQSAIGLLL